MCQCERESAPTKRAKRKIENCARRKFAEKSCAKKRFEELRARRKFEELQRQSKNLKTTIGEKRAKIFENQGYGEVQNSGLCS